jgi:predicted MFS family arabinose efflux permease
MTASNLYLVPLLTGRGMDTVLAAWALGLCGAGQLLGRVGYASFARRTGPDARTALLLAAGAAATLAVAVLHRPTVLVFIVVILLGATRGAITLLDATAVTDRWGANGYATLHGILSAPVTIAIALSPWAGALLAGWTGGHPQMFAVLAGLILLGAGIAVCERAYALAGRR